MPRDKGRDAPDFQLIDDLWTTLFSMEGPLCDLACAGKAVLRLTRNDDALAWAAGRQIEQAERLKHLYYAAVESAAALRKQREMRS